MGVISSYHRLTTMSRESARRTDVGASMSSMQAKLDAMNATMAAQHSAHPTVAVSDAGAHRVEATATVSAGTLTGATINGASVVELDLLVMLPGGIPMPIAQTTVVSPLHLHRLQPGSRLAVSLDPAVPATLVVAWDRVLV